VKEIRPYLRKCITRSVIVALSAQPLGVNKLCVCVCLYSRAIYWNTVSIAAGYCFSPSTISSIDILKSAEPGHIRLRPALRLFAQPFSLCSLVLLLWAAENGESMVVDLLLAIGDDGPDLKDGGGRTPLSWVAAAGHEAVVKLLLETGKVDVGSKDGGRRCHGPLQQGTKP
jgi:hypothetical protein